MTATVADRGQPTRDRHLAGLIGRSTTQLRDLAPGVVVVGLVAVAATSLGHVLTVIGGPVLGIVLGTAMGVAIVPGVRLYPGVTFVSGPILKVAIVVLGATLSLTQIATVCQGALPVMLGTLLVALVGAWVVGRLVGVRGDTGVLIGVGTAICGASAIAAASAVLRPTGAQVAHALGTIFTFNVVAVLTFPALGHLLGMTPQSFGLWAGTAINDTSSVVAAGYSFSADAGPHAVVVKLTRSLALIPIVIALALVKARRDSRQLTAGNEDGAARGRRASARWRSLPWRKIVPPFLVGFVVAAGLATAGAVPTSAQPGLTATGMFLITMALAAIGLSLKVSDVWAAGPRPLVLGAVLWVSVAASSLGLQALTGTF
jgi:uncharacterized integral membrane protein (TIGR00698 family)